MRIHLLALALGLAACNDKGGDDSSADIVGDAAAGATVYTSTCASCHGADGNVNEAKLTEEVPSKTDAELEDIILNGYDEMPPVGLDETELADVIAYLRQTFTG